MSDRRLDEKLKMIKETIYVWGTGKDVDKKVYTHRTEEEIINEISKIKVIK